MVPTLYDSKAALKILGNKNENAATNAVINSILWFTPAETKKSTGFYTSFS